MRKYEPITWNSISEFCHFDIRTWNAPYTLEFKIKVSEEVDKKKINKTPHILCKYQFMDASRKSEKACRLHRKCKKAGNRRMMDIYIKAIHGDKFKLAGTSWAKIEIVHAGHGLASTYQLYLKSLMISKYINNDRLVKVYVPVPVPGMWQWPWKVLRPRRWPGAFVPVSGPGPRGGGMTPGQMLLGPVERGDNQKKNYFSNWEFFSYCLEKKQNNLSYDKEWND